MRSPLCYLPKGKIVNIARMYLWIAALRTRKFTCPTCGTERTYTQGRGTMEGNHANGSKEQCCLGVAAYIARDNGCEVSVQPPNFDFVDVERRPTYFDGITNWMPQHVFEWYGLPSGNPVIPLLGDSAAAVNDAGYTFDDIAEGLEDMVRRELGLMPLVLPERRRCVGTRWTESMAAEVDVPCPNMTLPGSNKCYRHNGVAYDTWDAEGNLIQVDYAAYLDSAGTDPEGDGDASAVVNQVASETGETVETVQSIKDAMDATEQEGTWD